MDKIEKKKGPSDFLAYYVHRPIENKIVMLIGNTSITPNQISLLVNLIAYCATALFYFGHLLIASILTFVVGLLDGVDGKLARAKGMTTKLGKMEHPFDLLYEFSWLVALSLYLYNTTNSAMPLILCLISITLMSFYRACYDRFSKETGKSLDIYGRFDRIFRRVAGRRNLYNLHILFWILVGMPFYSLVTITIHAAITAFVYSFRACWHLHNLDKNS